MSEYNKRKEALDYHEKPVPGKISITPTKKYSTQRDLSLAYSPGVSVPCLEIEKDVNNVYKYTSKGNLIAIISNGTAVLGLGDIGPEASKPVMEGKALLFKIFADIDGMDIELDTKDVEKFIETVKIISPTFGGINLEDIKAPEAFEIERRLRDELDIPVMHDDQHGTAIISAAALLNALDLTGRDITKTKFVISGAGAAAVSCSRMYKTFGAKSENIVMLDSKGVIRSDRPHLSSEKLEFSTNRKIDTLEEAIDNADVFIGLSVADILSTKCLLKMAKDPIVFALSNPNPEINYDLAISTRKDIIMATGRSDLPNQVNNVLGFPYIFRGAMDVRAKSINEDMKIAAVKALSKLAKKTVPDQVNVAYGENNLKFGKKYIIPKPFDPRLIIEIPPKVAKAAMDSGIAMEPIRDWKAYEESLIKRMGADNTIFRLLYNRAKTNPKRIVFTEADQMDVLKSAQIAYEEGLCQPILLGNKKLIQNIKEKIGFDTEVEIIDVKEDLPQKAIYAEQLWLFRKRKGITLYEAKRRMEQRIYFGSMMVKMGDADGLITGYTRNYVDSLQPVLSVIGMRKGIDKAASANLMMTPRGMYFLADTSINIEPNADDIVNITKMTSDMAHLFAINPVIAILSYANFGSSKNVRTQKVKDAVNQLHQKYPKMIVDGEIQCDFALNKVLLKEKYPFSKLADKKVNTLIFPNLESSNIAYKMLKEINGSESVGPILMGLDKPVHIVQLGSSVDEMVSMVAIAVIDAQQTQNK